MDHSVRVRFAPSPTGHLHLGNVRTALFNWLFARRRGGTFILRIEDTDRERSTEESLASVLDDLRWLGLAWDEGPEVGGPCGPYRQTERSALYREALDRLVGESKAYACYCSQEELDSLRARAEAEKQTFIYPGTCRRLSPAERAAFEARGRKPVFRLAVPDETVTFSDLVRGSVSIHTGLFGDWVLTRADGSPTYNFAVVVDDAHMKVSHVIRGEDHLSNTPKQLVLYEALGLPPPAFAHLSMILGPDGAKLSKRHGDVSLDAFRAAGMLPSAVANGLALLGWSDGEGGEVFSLEELASRFDLSRVHKASAVFDRAKLRHLNGEHIRRLSDSELASLILPHLRAAGRLPHGDLPEETATWLEGLAGLVRDRIEMLPECVPATDAVWRFDLQGMDEEAREVLAEPQAPAVVRAFADKAEAADLTAPGAYREAVQSLRGDLKVKGKALFHPIRVALTAAASGPDLETLVPLLARGSGLALPAPVLGPCQRARKTVDYLNERSGHS